MYNIYIFFFRKSKQNFSYNLKLQINRHFIFFTFFPHHLHLQPHYFLFLRVHEKGNSITSNFIDVF